MEIITPLESCFIFLKIIVWVIIVLHASIVSTAR
jgi:hypothetical protein